jgi:fatty acid desaturase
MANTERIGRRTAMKLRRTIYALASLAALAMAIGAAWKPN